MTQSLATDRQMDIVFAAQELEVPGEVPGFRNR